MSDLNLTLWFACYVVVFAGLSVFGAHRLRILWLYAKNRKNEPKAKERFSELPVVTIQLPLFNELHVVERLCHAVSHLDYPREKLQIQILDDSTVETCGACEGQAGELRRVGFGGE
jgi:cellulose synthase/poly-beta-1,6-N-acetylglucosamine synthase-like glycosyltransferase